MNELNSGPANVSNKSVPAKATTESKPANENRLRFEVSPGNLAADHFTSGSLQISYRKRKAKVRVGGRSSVVSVAGEEFEGVGDRTGHETETFDGGLRTAGKTDDQ